MAGLIIVDRSDGRSVAGLLTSLIANWERIPVSVQSAIVRHAIETAFEGVGRGDGQFVVTGFIAKHRNAMMRETRWQGRAPRAPRSGVGGRAREAVETFRYRRRQAMQAAARLIRRDAAIVTPRRPRSVARAPWWSTLMASWKPLRWKAPRASKASRRAA